MNDVEIHGGGARGAETRSVDASGHSRSSGICGEIRTVTKGAALDLL